MRGSPILVALLPILLAAPAQAQVTVSKTLHLAIPWANFPETAQPPTVVYKAQRKSLATEGEYQRGMRLESDRELGEAAAAYRKAASAGHVDAMLALAAMYMHGRGVAQDDAEAVLWLRRAAEYDSVLGQYNLAVMLAGGNGAAVDVIEAVRWYERAAAAGFDKAQFNLAMLLVSGKVSQAQPELAYVWMKQAASSGMEAAQNNLPIIAARMNAEQLARAESLFQTRHVVTAQ